jgi:hypothetical protein
MLPMNTFTCAKPPMPTRHMHKTTMLAFDMVPGLILLLLLIRRPLDSQLHPQFQLGAIMTMLVT